MVSVKEQYESYPYPERRPEDEKKRLISGSPSHPLEIDHYLFGGQRDWSKPLKVLVAGGGTGDALIQIAQMMTSAGAPYEITYVDLSTASREVAEARAKVRGLTGITFVTGSLLDAAKLGQFDYIDCCGVLHHLPDPDAGFAALRAAVAPGGGMGFMVYAPYGRAGIYQLQEAFGTLFDGMAPQARLAKAKKIVGGLHKGHPFAANGNVTDHKQSDAGFYDLLLHGQDTPFDIPRLLTTLENTGWKLQSLLPPGLYDLARITDRPKGMDDATAMALAEKLRGTMKKHLGYLVPSDEDRPIARGSRQSLVPRSPTPDMRRPAQAVAQGRPLPITLKEADVQIKLPRECAPLLAAIDNRRTIAQIQQVTKLDPLRFGDLWGRVERELTAWGLLHYSSFGL
ncbi:class I SAM-dependent methyltransferase [Mameliella sediminis]|uniref:class I SAM-dependent methyltransferase n=1 Tax=Mameliella sediminis TaxID=2836866 RepID=UPI001C461AD1|nr:class I SAM-dependent methyltransferase [Mameliella sediminis]MBV7395776.1 class I SAM-dependent methyltransferase [Mameliella sediminis]